MNILLLTCLTVSSLLSSALAFTTLTTTGPLATTVRGVDPTFYVTGTQSWQSPLLMPSSKPTFMKFRSHLGDKRSVLAGVKTITCYNDLGGNLYHTSWSQKLYVDIKDPTRAYHRICIKLIDVNTDPYLCQTFKVTLKFDVALRISGVEFGTESVCKFGLPVSFQCDTQFSSGDCGIRNDACGLVDWEIRPAHSYSNFETSTTTCDQTRLWFPMPKKKMTDSCFYDFQIPAMQPSGFHITRTSTYDNEAIITRQKRSSSYSLFLVPSSNSGGVAVGVLDLPVVQHDAANAFLSFLYEMFETGFHDLMVTAVCTSNPANSLVPLDQNSLHYHKLNLSGGGDSGRICLDIHEYVLPQECSNFAIQLHGAAAGTPLVVDTISFASTLAALSCSAAENVAAKK